MASPTKILPQNDTRDNNNNNNNLRLAYHSIVQLSCLVSNVALRYNNGRITKLTDQTHLLKARRATHARPQAAAPPAKQPTFP